MTKMTINPLSFNDDAGALEDILETRGVGSIPKGELLLYMCRVTKRAESLGNQAKTLDTIVDALLDSGAEFTDPTVAPLMEHLDSLDQRMLELSLAHSAIAERVVEEL